jgi:hypothetical protein
MGSIETPTPPPAEDVPDVVRRAWEEYGDHRTIVAVSDISATVSTNKVYRAALSDGHEVIAKTTIYGSYVHFRQDHRIIQQWNRRLVGTPFRNLLAQICLREDGEVFTAHIDETWVVFYEKAEFYDFLPKILTPGQITSLGIELAELHKASTAVAPLLSKSWKSLGSDIATLYDMIGNPAWRKEHDVSPQGMSVLRSQCDQFLTNAEKLGYHRFEKIPVLIDWNIGNFSVGFDGEGFRFFSRWDYDWFRVEPRTLDFYFCARVVRAEGDQDTFSYTLDPFFEPRFLEFLRAYHATNPLTGEEILFMKESYRVFLLNYLFRVGEHFFRDSFKSRLQKEALEVYFPILDRTDFSPLLSVLEA